MEIREIFTLWQGFKMEIGKWYIHTTKDDENLRKIFKVLSDKGELLGIKEFTWFLDLPELNQYRHNTEMFNLDLDTLENEYPADTIVELKDYRNKREFRAFLKAFLGTLL